MSCLDVMHRQTYGARQYSPTALYRQHQSHQKLVLHSKMQEWVESSPETTKEESDKERAPEAEYISSRCVLLTYFQGDIGSVVDEHFSRALSQSSFSPKPLNSTSNLWREGAAFSTNQKSNFPASFWSGSYEPPAVPCLTGGHPDFSTASPGAVFHRPDASVWPGHGLRQPPALPPSAEAWPYTLTSQAGSGYPLLHEVYPRVHHPHAHAHAHHHHHHASHLDPRYGSLLAAARASASPSEIAKAETTAAASSWTGAFHGTLEVAQGVNLDPGLLHQEKNKEPTWF